MTEVYEIIDDMYDALKSKLDELVTDGTLQEVIEGFREELPSSYPVVYLQIADQRLEEATVSKDTVILEADVVVESFSASSHGIGMKEARDLGWKVYSKLVEDRTLGGNVDYSRITQEEIETEMYPDGYLFHVNIYVELHKWYLG